MIENKQPEPQGICNSECGFRRKYPVSCQQHNCNYLVKNKQPEVKCPLCGGDGRLFDASYERALRTVIQSQFNCHSCNTSIIMAIPLQEALARFNQRPEVKEIKVLEALKKYLERSIDPVNWQDYETDIENKIYDRVLTKISELEKELKG